jgi:Domain of unknown function (DUF6891)
MGSNSKGFDMTDNITDATDANAADPSKPAANRVSANALRKAFTELRADGYFARMNFLCCQTCAWDAVPDDHRDKAVFYHAQDNDDLAKRGTLHLTWSGDAKFIRAVLEKHGLAVDHDGSENQRIFIAGMQSDP